jgi:hypothetical protein
MIRNRRMPYLLGEIEILTTLSPDRSTLLPLLLTLFVVLFGGILAFADATPSRILPPSPASGPGQAVENPER